MPDFPHLKLPFKVEGSAKTNRGGSRDENSKAITEKNKTYRAEHGSYLGSSAKELIVNWEKIREEKKSEGITLPNSNDIPIFLRVDTEVFNIDNFKLWGIELISEEENGYIIGASTDNLNAFFENVNDFINEKGQRKDKAAQIWEIVTDESSRIRQLLKGELGEIWETIVDEEIYTVQIGVSCISINTKEYPERD